MHGTFNHLRSCMLWLGLAAVPSAIAWAQGGEKVTTLDDQLGVAVTIYNEDLALVKDRRKITVDQGEGVLAFKEVSARMQPETALLRSPQSDGALRVIEQNFDFDLLTPQKLLDKYVGRSVGIVKVHPTTGEEAIENATVLSTQQGVVLRVGDRIETGPPGRLVFPDVPANLRERPTLVMQLHSDKGGARDVELSYLTGGLSWRADYVAELADNDQSLDLNGWVTLTNASGATYRNAQLQLVAGNVHRAVPEFAPLRRGQMDVLAQAAEAPMAEEGLFEYHLYTLDRPTTIADQQTKQVALLGALAVPAAKEFVLHGAEYYYLSSYGELGQKMPVAVYLEFKNNESSHLGMPLPKGVVRVYKKDSRGNAQFVGEDRIDHTPKNETVRMKLGDAFDVTADKKQTEFKKVQGFSQYNYVYETAFEIVLKNAKNEPVTVVVQEPIPGDWAMLKESARHEKATAHTALWKIPVPPEGQATLSYRVQVRQ